MDTARDWLRKYGYDEVAQNIDSLMSKWKLEGKKTRRNWWEVLAGGKNGLPRTINGIVFPVLKTAQLRQNKPVTLNAIQISVDEPAQQIRMSARWDVDKGEDDAAQ